MQIHVNAPVQLETNEIAKVLSAEDLGSLISDLANRFAGSVASHERRKVAGLMMGGLSEAALVLLAECVALGYHNSKVWAKGTDKRPA